MKCLHCGAGNEYIEGAASNGLTSQYLDRITDLEAKLAQSNHELAELRRVHRQMVEGMNGLGERLIDDTCG